MSNASRIVNRSLNGWAPRPWKRTRKNPTLYALTTESGDRILHTGNKQPVAAPYVSPLRSRPYTKPEDRDARDEARAKLLDFAPTLLPASVGGERAARPGTLNLRPAAERIEAALKATEP